MLKPSGRMLFLFAALLLGVYGCTVMEKISTDDVPRMQADELKSRLNDPALIIIDVRAYDDWKESLAQIKGAVREIGGDESGWAHKYSKNKTIVLYCA